MVLTAFPGQNQLMFKIIGADGREYGPITADQLREWIAEGRATAQTRVQAEGSAQWKPLTEYLEFAASLARTLPPRPAPGPIFINPTPRTNSMALAAMVMGILSLSSCVCCCGCCYGLPFNVLGVIFALVALSQIKNDPQLQHGRGLAITGLILCLVSVFMAAVSLAFGLAMTIPDILRQIQRL
jgi:hypothetical protein